MEIPAGLLKALAAVNGKTYTSEQFFEGEGENRKPLSEGDIIKIISDDYKAKHDALGNISAEKETKIRENERKLVYTDFETKAKEQFDVNIKWTENGFAPISEHFNNKLKNTKIDPSDVSKTPLYLERIGEIKQLQADKAQLIANHQQERVYDKVTNNIDSLLGNEEFKFVVPTSEVVRSTSRATAEQKMKNATYKGKPVKWGVDANGMTTVSDSDGHPIYDENGNVVSPQMVKVEVLKSVYDVNVSNPRGSAGAGDKSRQSGGAGTGATSGKVTTYVKDGKDVSFTMPEFKNKVEAYSYLNEHAFSLDKGIKDVVREHIKELPDKE